MTPHLAEVWAPLTDLAVESGTGATITTVDGTEYLDLTSGIGVVNTGHCHPRVVEAIATQAGRFLHAQVNCYRHDLLAPLSARLAEVTPDGVDTFFYANSGVEAVEAAVKLAKQATGNGNVVVFEGSFHGRSHLGMAMTTSKAVYRAGYAPVPSGVFVAPFPYPFLTGEDERTCVARCLREFDLLLQTQTRPSEVAAVVLEPVLGEGGYVPAPPGFVEGIAARCRDKGMLFVADEIQTGFGRTGELFALDHVGVRPDILVMAKGMGSGFPISAIGASREVMARWPVGSHGGTYGGNPMGCAAAMATIDVLTTPGFLADVRARGAQFHRGLEALRTEHPAIAQNRGLGLMLATEIVGQNGAPAPDRVSAVLRHLLHEEHVVAMSCGPFGATLRWIPPLIVTATQVDRALEAFGRALRATAARRPVGPTAGAR